MAHSYRDPDCDVFPSCKCPVRITRAASAPAHPRAPQLFGHEIIAVLCGDVWGIWIGFGIVAAGTLFGELANYLCVRLPASRRCEC